MDLSFGGPDNTSANRPFTFWANNDYDRGNQVDCGLINCDWEEDDLKVAGALNAPTIPTPDYAYSAYAPFQQPAPLIPSMRDLEDYARLWCSGLSSLMAVMPTNHTVKLTLTGDAQIRIFRAVESDGGTDYLFNEVTASNQVAQSASLFVGLLTSASPITLSGQTNFSEYFIWCGAKRGNAEIHLQVLDGDQNLLADTATYFEIKDIKEMYERWTVGDKGSIAPTTTAYLAVEDLPVGVSKFEYGPSDSTNTPYVLHVHGWNMERWEKDRYGETMFKRLYWQGYQGRFGIFRWPTLARFPAALGEGADLNHFDKSEWNAWKSGVPLRQLLLQLNNKHPGQVYLTAHSMGNVVAGEALRTNTTFVHTYVAMEAAVPAHAYDATMPTRSIPFLADDGTPNRYAHYWQSNSPPYFNGVTGAANYVNFFNTNDYAFAPIAWPNDQNLKPAGSIGYGYIPDNGKFYKEFYSTELGFPADT
jgi:hypothetical protein